MITLFKGMPKVLPLLISASLRFSLLDLGNGDQVCRRRRHKHQITRCCCCFNMPLETTRANKVKTCRHLQFSHFNGHPEMTPRATSCGSRIDIAFPTMVFQSSSTSSRLCCSVTINQMAMRQMFVVHLLYRILNLYYKL